AFAQCRDGYGTSEFSTRPGSTDCRRDCRANYRDAGIVLDLFRSVSILAANVHLLSMRSFIALTVAFIGIAQASAEQRNDKILIQGNAAGMQTEQIDATGTAHVEYSYNDRGRGDHIIATWKLDAAGVPTEYEGNGNDYMKAPIEEQFEVKDGKARWKNRSEQGEQAITGEAFYVPANAPPEFVGVLARALLKAPGHKLSLLPAGEASIEGSGKISVDGVSGK